MNFKPFLSVHQDECSIWVWGQRVLTLHRKRGVLEGIEVEWENWRETHIKEVSVWLLRSSLLDNILIFVLPFQGILWTAHQCCCAYGFFLSLQGEYVWRGGWAHSRVTLASKSSVQCCSSSWMVGRQGKGWHTSHLLVLSNMALLMSKSVIKAKSNSGSTTTQRPTVTMEVKIGCLGKG